MSAAATKEIGGYLEMEHFTGEEYYSDLYKLNLGRTALVWLLHHIKPNRVFIPAYICKSVIDSTQKAGFQVELYGLDTDLRPVWNNRAPEDCDVIYLVNYYGQLRNEDIVSFRDAFPEVIVDNAQSFYDRPIDGVHTLYSPRKFFGISDGAYLNTDADGIAESYDSLKQDCSVGRMTYLVGRLEETGGKYYRDMLAAADTFSNELPGKMSRFTQNMMKGIDYEYVKKRRCDNYRILSELLPSDNPFTVNTPTCPFAYPYYHKDGVALRKYLAEKKVFVPTNWTYLIDKMPPDSLEYKWSSDILPLPVDQRYSEPEMNTIADCIREFDAL